jgi:hypothetical protein
MRFHQHRDISFELPRFRFGNPKSTTPTFVCRCSSCGILMVIENYVSTSQRRFFIAFNLHLHARVAKITISAWVLSPSRAFRFCAYKRWPQAVYSYQMNAFFCTAHRLQSMRSFMQCAIAIIWHCRRRFFLLLLVLARLRNCDIFIVAARCCYKFFFSVSHGEWLHAFMASDYASVLPFNVV